jgi:predicted ATPase
MEISETPAASFTSRNLFLRKLQIKNYKSIANANIDFAPLTIFVGTNGSGKSNLLDALAFVADSLARPLDHALKDRGGINEVRRRSTGHPKNFGLRLDVELPSGITGHYGFEIAARASSGYVVKNEQCAVTIAGRQHSFNVTNGNIVSSMPNPPAATNDRLYLVNLSGTVEFREMFDALSSMQIYAFNPDRIRALQAPSAEAVLSRDGSNITTIFAHLSRSKPQVKKLIEEYLSVVVPGIHGVEVKNLGPVETLEFRQDVHGAPHPWSFLASNMSDGTLRAFGILVALFQHLDENTSLLPVIGIEEPEISLHPAALSLILQSLVEVSKQKQVIVTSHSPDLLASDELLASSIRSVVAERGATYIANVSAATRSVLMDGLYSAGELLRIGKLEADAEEISRQEKQISLFSLR